jgi:uncharacterized membrane protein YbhN (UPF0104 family)
MTEPVPNAPPQAPSFKAKKWAMFVLGCGLSVGILAWAWWSVDKAAVDKLWRAVPVWAWCVAAMAWALSFVLRAIRLQLEWRWQRAVPWHAAMRLVLFHNAAVLLLPLRAGEMGYPLLVKQTFGASWRDALRSLLWLRLQDVVVLGVLAALLWPGLPVLGRVLVLCAVAVPFVLPKRVWRWVLSRRFWLVAQLRRLMHRRGSPAGWWLSAGNWVLKISVVGALLQALLPEPLTASASWGFGQALSAALGGELAALIPVQGPAGLGTYEAGVWLLSGLPLAEAPLMAVVALAVHVFCLVVSLALAGAWSLGSAWVGLNGLKK